jgi:MoxR-like ATPase
MSDEAEQSTEDEPLAARLLSTLERELEEVVIGQREALRLMLVALACRGHVLLQGVPGLAKTLLARALASALDLDMRRVQFTPDMLPSDLTGTMTLRGNELEFRAGPLFTNVLLADEINRTPPKTQAALLEAMQEAQVTVDGRPHPLGPPFLVIATQNPVEYEGTYPLPEAQLDRFLVQVELDYPDAEEELRVLELPRQGGDPVALERIRPVIGGGEIERLAREAEATRVEQAVAEYAVAIVRRTRELPAVALGASPRAGVHLLAAGRAWARLQGRDFLTPDDIVEMAVPVLAHRLVMTTDAELDRYGSAQALQTVLGELPVPR